MRLAAPAISIAPHALHSMIAVVPAMRSRSARAVQDQRCRAAAIKTISSKTVVNPPVMKPPKNAL